MGEVLEEGIYSEIINVLLGCKGGETMRVKVRSV